jgi:hypothetical protein
MPLALRDDPWPRPSREIRSVLELSFRFGSWGRTEPDHLAAVPRNCGQQAAAGMNCGA